MSEFPFYWWTCLFQNVKSKPGWSKKNKKKTLTWQINNDWSGYMETLVWGPCLRWMPSVGLPHSGVPLAGAATVTVVFKLSSQPSPLPVYHTLTPLTPPGEWAPGLACQSASAKVTPTKSWRSLDVSQEQSGWGVDWQLETTETVVCLRPLWRRLPLLKARSWERATERTDSFVPQWPPHLCWGDCSVVTGLFTARTCCSSHRFVGARSVSSRRQTHSTVFGHSHPAALFSLVLQTLSDSPWKNNVLKEHFITFSRK